MGEAKRRMTARMAVEELAGSGGSLLSRQILERRSVRRTWKTRARRLLDAHFLAVAAVTYATERMAAIPGRTSPSVGERLALSASFIQGIELCEVAISEGLYLQAATLLRQEMETLAAIRESDKGHRKERKTPNVKHLPQHIAKLYGDLSAATHVADQYLIREVLSVRYGKHIHGASLIPIYNEVLSKFYYSVQIALIIMLACEIQSLFSEMYGAGLDEREDRLIAKSTAILKEHGSLEPPVI
jgi:hypothetical protein